MDENNKVDDVLNAPKNSNKVIIIICVCVVAILSVVYVFGNQNPVNNTITKVQKASKEALGSDLVDYLNNGELNDFDLIASSKVGKIDGNVHVNLGSDVLTMETTINDVAMNLFLNNEDGVLNLGSDTNYGFKTQTFGEDLSAYLEDEGLGKQETLEDINLAYNSDIKSFSDVTSTNAYKGYTKYQSKLNKEFSKSLEKEKIKGKETVKRDGVSFSTKAVKYIADEDDIKTYVSESLNAYFLLMDSNMEGNTEDVDYENGKISNDELKVAYENLSDSLDEMEVSAEITLYEYDNIIVKTQIDWFIEYEYSDSVEEITTNLYILDTKNVLNNMQFEVISEYGESGINISSVESDKKDEKKIVGLNFESIEDDDTISNFGYTIDTTIDKKNNAKFYYSDNYVDLEYDFTYNIIDDKFVIGFDFDGIADLTLVISENEIEQTMPEADEELFEVGLEEIVEKEMDTFEAIQSIFEMVYYMF